MAMQRVRGERDLAKRQRYRRRADALSLLVSSLIAVRRGYIVSSSSLSLRRVSADSTTACRQSVPNITWSVRKMGLRVPETNTATVDSVLVVPAPYSISALFLGAFFFFLFH